MAIKRVSDLAQYVLSTQNNKLHANDLLEIETYDESNPELPLYISKKLTYGELLSSLLLEFGEAMSKRSAAISDGPAIADTDPLVTYKKLPSPFPLGTLFHTTIPYQTVSSSILLEVKISSITNTGNVIETTAISSVGSYLPADGGIICPLSTYQQYIVSADVSAYVADSYLMSNGEFDSLFQQLSAEECKNENSIFYTISAVPYDISKGVQNIYRPITGYVRNRFYAYWSNYRYGWRYGWYGYGYGYPYGAGYPYGYIGAGYPYGYGGYGYGYPYYGWNYYYNNYWWLWYHRPWARRLPHWHPMRKIYENRLSMGQELYSQSMLYRSDGSNENPLADQLSGLSCGSAPDKMIYLPTLKNIYIENTDEVSADHTFDVPSLPNIAGRFHSMSNCGVAEGVFKSELAHIERYHAIFDAVGVGDYTFDASRNSSTYDLSNLGEVKPFSVKLVPYVLIKTLAEDYVVTKINFAKMNPFAS